MWRKIKHVSIYKVLCRVVREEMLTRNLHQGRSKPGGVRFSTNDSKCKMPDPEPTDSEAGDCTWQGDGHTEG